MSLRVAAPLAALLCLSGPASAREPAAKAAPSLRDKDPALSPARERQKRCGTEWRGLSTAEKAAKGPTWPQFYSKCVKRLKDPKQARVGRPTLPPLGFLTGRRLSSGNRGALSRSLLRA